MNRKAFSLIEIIISMIILALTLGGLVNLFISGKRWILLSRSRMTGGELGRRFIDPLQMDVRQDQWTANCLSQDGVNPAACQVAPYNTPWVDPVTGITYTPNYNNGSPPGVPNLRRVQVTIQWRENAP